MSCEMAHKEMVLIHNRRSSLEEAVAVSEVKARGTEGAMRLRGAIAGIA